MVWALAPWLCFALPSVGVVYKYLGGAGALSYLAATLALFVWLQRDGSRWARQSLDRVPPITSGLAAAAVIALFVAVHPYADETERGGSDRNEALNVAANSLLDGEFPYNSRTYLGNPISPMPGAVLLATPFVLLGDSAFQNVFWLAVAAAFLYVHASRAGRMVVPAVLGLSPLVVHEYVTGGDLLANSLYILCFVLGLLGASTLTAGQARGRMVLCSVLLGIGLSSRANFALLLPLIGASMVNRAGWRQGLLSMGIVLATAGAVTIPFYLHDPAAFTPLQTWRVLNQSGATLPVQVGIPAVAFSLSLYLAVDRHIDRTEVFLRCATAVLALPFIALTAVAVIQRGMDGLALAGYGLPAVIFAAAAWCATHLRLSEDEPGVRDRLFGAAHEAA